MLKQNRNKNTITIPNQWTVEQADAVLEFLNSVIDSIFHTYDHRLVELWIERNREENEMEEMNNYFMEHDDGAEIPF